MTTESLPGIPAEISAAIAHVKTQIIRLAKTGRNKYNAYNYASVDQFYEAVGPLEGEAGLTIWVTEDPDLPPELVPMAKADKEGSSSWLKIRWTIFISHSSGAQYGPLYRTIMVPASGAQAFGSAESYVQKQFARSLYRIPTGEADRIADARTPDVDEQEKQNLPQGDTIEQAIGKANTVPKLKTLLAAAEANGEDAKWLNAIQEKIKSMTVKPASELPQKAPAKPAAKTQEAEPAKFSWPKGTPQSRTRFSLESIQAAPTTERVNEISKGVEKAKADIGEDNWRLVCEAATKREKELAPAQEDTGSPFDDGPQEDEALTFLRQTAGEKKTVADVDELAKRWQEDSERLDEPTYDAGCLILSKARASLPA